jgi:hypothetical protein
MRRMNQPERASILTGTFPKSTVPDMRISRLSPKSALMAKKLLKIPKINTTDRVIIPLNLVLTKRRAKTDDNNMANTILINVINLK